MIISKRGLIDPISLAIAAGIIMLAFIFIVIMPIVFLKIHLTQIVNFEYDYNNAQLALNTILSLTKRDTIDGKIKPVSKIIAEYITMENKPNIEFVKAELDKMVEEGIFKCYILTSESGEELARKDCQRMGMKKASKYTVFSFISTPESVQKLKLVIE